MECPYSELFWSVFFRIRTEYAVRIQENTIRITPNMDTFHAVSRSKICRLNLVYIFKTPMNLNGTKLLEELNSKSLEKDQKLLVCS